LLVVLIVAPASAEPLRRDHDITIDDYFTQATLFSASISPDGKLVAYTDGRWQESTDDRKIDLWVVDTKGERSRRLTFDRANDRSPAWSPDSRWIYFLGNRKREGEKRPPYDGKPQVWRISPDGGEPQAVTRVEGGVGLFNLARDGRSLIYTTETEVVETEWKALRERFRDIRYGHGVVKLSQVWRLDLDSWRTERLPIDQRNVRDLALAPDGQQLALITTPDETVISFEGKSKVEIYDAKTRKVATIPDKLWRDDAPSPYGWLEHLAWSADSKLLAFSIAFDGYPAEAILIELASEQPRTFKLSRPEGVSLKGYGSKLAWRGNKPTLCFLGEEKARIRLYAAEIHPGKTGPVQILTPGDVVVEDFSFDATGTKASFIQSDPKSLQDVWLLDGDQKRRLTRVNPQADSWKIPKLSKVAWKGAEGQTVEGVLELPHGAKDGQKFPLVVDIHGGPTTATPLCLQYWIYGRTLLPAKGYAVLSPNYRGSTGYGDKFLTDLIGRENDLDVEDILKGVDHLVELGIADPDRLAVMGWSNGGYLTNCIITKTTRFKAASSGAGILDTVMEWGSNDEPAYAIVFKQGFPWNKADVYKKTSPTYQLDKIRTPTLIHVGGEDERCPPSHSRMLHRALREYLKVPTELLIYPGEPHGLTKYKNRKAKMEWDVAWFDRYVLGKKEN
jgi:dipeptidyl aminopeptidase/acylaminoacyl peptidase